MATATERLAGVEESTASPKHHRFSLDRWLPPALITPSFLAIIIFVYGFIGYTLYVSFSNWRKPTKDLSLHQPFRETYETLFQQRRFQDDLRNTFVFTVFFLLLAVAMGLGLAILLDRHIPFSGFFRSVILFPYALSFITTGVVWRWLFTPSTGINLLFDYSGINTVLSWFGAGPFEPKWITSPEIWGDLNSWVPFLSGVKSQLGIPAALLPVTFAASWQLSGFAMAMYLAGMGTINNEVREAAALDGASTWRTYKDIIIPLLKPITVSILIILGHVSLKIFDLVVAMTGGGPGFNTDVPGIYVFDMSFAASRYNLGASAAIVMLLLVSIVIVPYLARQLKEL